ncbi:hypothetical protein ABW19_dt0200050 [Dactylella cylindrospora]|nr:hypothetical protein ABW19_dt0200050 [Dactylella cylindrospora]
MINFTGNARRSRQVNLSGKPKSSASNHLSGRGTGSSLGAVTAARELRVQRETERQRYAAAVRIQSLFRGHMARLAIRQSYRKTWDELVGFSDLRPAFQRGGQLALRDDAMALFLLFWDPSNADDLNRLFFVVSAFRPDDPVACVLDAILREHGHPPIRLIRLCRIILAALTALSHRLEDPGIQNHTFLYLSFLSQVVAYSPTLADISYFQMLAKIVEHGFLQFTSLDAGLGLTASRTVLQSIVLPLQPQTIMENLSAPYALFAQAFLSTPYLNETFFPYVPAPTLRILIDAPKLFEAISNIQTETLSPSRALWLLSYLIFLGNAFDSRDVYAPDPTLEGPILHHPKYKPTAITDPFHPTRVFGSYVAAVDRILDICGAEIAYRWDTPEETQSRFQSRHAAKGAFSGPYPNMPADIGQKIPAFVKGQLNLLLDNKFVQNLADLVSSGSLAKNISYTKGSQEIAQSLALHSLLYFKQIRQKLHNRLFLARSSDGAPLLSTLVSRVQETQIFRKGLSGTRDILEELKVSRRSPSSALAYRTSEWTVLFLFLDMYSFASIVMDDEEFFSFKDKALPSAELKLLITFLKNLAFIAFFEVSEIEAGSAQESAVPSVSSVTRSNRIQTRANVAGVTGVTLPWIRSLSVRILRSLHRRDSRQQFLPEDFWLLNEIEMEGSTLLVAEEEARQQEPNEVDPEDESDSSDEQSEEASFSGHREISNRSREKDARRNYLAAITPRLEILQNLPFLIPFKTRVKIFRNFIHLDQVRRGTQDSELWRLNQATNFLDHNGRKPKHHGVIRRDRIFEDAYDSFYTLGEGFKEPIQITFVDSFGAEEAGIDGGGILKEFLSSVVYETFKGTSLHGPSFFTATEDHLVYPNPTLFDSISGDLVNGITTSHADNRLSASPEALEMLKRFEFLGRIIGKCMYEGILVDVGFTDFFLLKWSKVVVGNDDVGLGVDDLKSLDRGLWKGLQALKHYDDQTIEDLALTFSVENTFQIEDHSKPGGYAQKTITVDLKTGGSTIPVNSSNRLEYIHLLSRYRLVVQGRLQTNAFLRGLSSIIAPRWLSMFNQSELQTLVGGNDSPLDIEDLRQHTIYGGIYTIGDDNQEHPTIEMFWRVMKRLNENDKRAVLKFVTSVSRAPLLGFSALNPRFSIRDAGGDSNRLPSTSTCVNLLKLPRYSSDAIMEEKLLYAANAGAGFDLS